MKTTELDFAPDGRSRWAGMGDYILLPPNRRHDILLRYLGEPPHGDSYHELQIDGAKFPGQVWGGNFAFSPDSRLLAASWMAEHYERKTILVDVEHRLFLVLPEYFEDFAFEELRLIGVGQAAGRSFAIDDSDDWTRF